MPSWKRGAGRNIFPSKKAAGVHAEAHTHYFVTWCVTKLMAESQRFETHTLFSLSLSHTLQVYIRVYRIGARAEKRIGASAESISARPRDYPLVVVYARRRVLRLLDTAAGLSTNITHSRPTTYKHSNSRACSGQKQRVIKITSNDEIGKKSGGRRTDDVEEKSEFLP